MGKARPKIKCPKCGNVEPTKFHYVEDVQCERSIHGFLSDGTLALEEDSRVYYEAASNDRLECRVCGQTVDVPEGLKLDVMDKMDFDEVQKALA